MSGSGRAGNGRGNNRKRLFRRRNNDGDTRQNTWQEKEDKGNNASQVNSGSQVQDSFRGNLNTNGGNSFRSPQRQQEKKNRQKWSDENQNRNKFNRNAENNRVEKAPPAERPKWVPPKLNTNPLPVPDCPYCGKPIREISQAIADKDTGVPVHFDCVSSRIAGGEVLEKDDYVTYIGAGRFGIVNLNSKSEFKIKKIIEWENKDKRADWRSEICEHYLVT